MEGLGQGPLRWVRLGSTEFGDDILKAIAFAAVLYAAMAFPGSLRAQDPKIPADTEIKTTPSGLSYCVLTEGKGTKHPKIGDEVVVRYSGWLASNGKLFDSTTKHPGGQPARFMLGRVVEGWNEGLQLMTKGARFKLMIPAKLGYGARGAGADIPPNADLIFEVELVDFTEGEPILARPTLDPAKTETLPSGIKFQVVRPGTGDDLGPKDMRVVNYSAWGKADGALMVCAQFQKGRRTALTAAGGDFDFLKDLAPKLKNGTQLWVELPGKLLPRPGPDILWNLVCEDVVPFDPPKDAKTTKTESGLEITILKEGEGTAPNPTSSVTCHYTGWLESGKVFDSSVPRREPTSFPLSGVIKGWTEGLQHLKPGGVAIFKIPGDLAYGARGRPPVIPPDATLIFRIELLKVQ